MISTVKIAGNGYVVNGTQFVPHDIQNRHYGLVQEWLDKGNTPEPEHTPAELEAQRISQIKQKAGVAINELLPEWKQRNLLARAIELIDPAHTMTPVEQAELNKIRAAWASIKGIRASSNAAEASGAAASTFNP